MYVRYPFQRDVIVAFFFFQAEDGIRDGHVRVQTCALPISIWLTFTMRLIVDRQHHSQRNKKTEDPHEGRSEERRVGKECRTRRSAYDSKKKTSNSAS